MLNYIVYQTPTFVYLKGDCLKVFYAISTSAEKRLWTTHERHKNESNYYMLHFFQVVEKKKLYFY